MANRLHLFQGYGIELEYMIVDRDTLDIRPVADELLKEVVGEYASEFENGSVTWSNELVLHVIELKCSEPVGDLKALEQDFVGNIAKINQILLEKFNARLMPTAAHPWVSPKEETVLWPHGQSEIYEKYNELFDCGGHGWSNLQSIHINLPFYDDAEFAALHTAVRLILPILPALAASSPILDGNFTGYHDTRLVYYQNNQRRIDSITGCVIPEQVSSKRQYQRLIYNKIRRQVKPFDPGRILDPVWLNSRGVIARFDRGSIEIRILDIQECPQADLAIAALIIGTVKLLVDGRLGTYVQQLDWEIAPLYRILQKNICSSCETVIDNREYMRVFGVQAEQMNVMRLWSHLLDLCILYYPDELGPWEAVLRKILVEGSLAVRILQAVRKNCTMSNLKSVYRELSRSLEENRLFAL